MLSSETWECLERNLKIGHALNCYGVLLIPVGNHFKVEFHRSPALVRSLTLWAFFINLCSIPALLNYAFTCNQDIPVTLFFLSAMLGIILNMGFQVWQWALHEEINGLVSSFVQFQQNLCKAARIPMKSEKDGYERILTLINISYIVACVALIPSLLIFFSFVRNSLTTPVFCVFDKLALLLGFTDASKEIPSTFLKVLWFFLVGTANINGALNMNLFVNFAVIYTNSTKLWMTKLCNQLENERDPRSKRKHQLTYTAHQVFNEFTNDVFAYIVEFALYVFATFLTLSIYVVLRLYRTGFGVLPIFITLVGPGCFVLVSCLTLGASCYSTSADCCQAQKKFGSLNGKCDNIFWFSRKPTPIRVGHHFSLRSRTYVLEVFGDSILKAVVDLLVTF